MECTHYRVLKASSYLAVKVEASEQILQSRGEGSTADFLFTLSKSCSMTLVFGVCVSIDENSSLTHYSLGYFFCSLFSDTALRR